VFDVDGGLMQSRADVEAMVLGRGHQRLLPNCAHTIGPAAVRVDGDTAIAVGYSRIYHRQADDFVLFRIGCNRWDLSREADGWRIARHDPRARLRGGASRAGPGAPALIGAQPSAAPVAAGALRGRSLRTSGSTGGRVQPVVEPAVRM
jgi:hypothetical protein